VHELIASPFLDYQAGLVLHLIYGRIVPRAVPQQAPGTPVRITASPGTISSLASLYRRSRSRLPVSRRYPLLWLRGRDAQQDP
jgi:hypothetical protein